MIDDQVDRILASRKTTPICIRLPQWLIERAKSEAARRGIPYPSQPTQNWG